MPFEAAPGDSILYRGPANLERGIEAVGGHLLLTAHWLAFAAHAFNVQSAPLNLPVTTIASVTPCLTRVFGVPLVPNSIEVRTTDGAEYRFVVTGRAAWIAAILEAAARARGAAP